MQIKNLKDFRAGLLFIAAGLFFAGLGARYTLGSAAEMGAGYFPTLIGVLTVLIGLYVAASALGARAASEQVKPFAWTTMLLVLGPVVLFGLLLEAMGLVFCVLMVVLLASRASHEFSWRGALASAAVMVALCLLVFVFALDLQFPLWPDFAAFPE